MGKRTAAVTEPEAEQPEVQVLEEEPLVPGEPLARAYMDAEGRRGDLRVTVILSGLIALLGAVALGDEPLYQDPIRVRERAEVVLIRLGDYARHSMEFEAPVASVLMQVAEDVRLRRFLREVEGEGFDPESHAAPFDEPEFEPGADEPDEEPAE